MTYLISLSIILVEYFALHQFAKGWIEKKYSIYSFLTLSLVATMIIRFSNIVNNTILESIILMISSFLILSICFDGKAHTKLLITSVFYILIYSIDFLTVYLLSFLFTLTGSDLLNSPLLFMLGAFISKVLLFTLCFTLDKKLLKKETLQLTVLQHVQIILYLLLGLLSIYLLLEYSLMSNQVHIYLFLVSIVILSIISQIYLVQKLSQSNMKIHEAHLLEIKMETMLDKHITLTELYDSQRKMTHEFKNHLSSIYYFLQHKDLEKALDYIDEISPIVNSVLVVKTNNPLIDSLLSEKYQIAKHHNIDIQFLIDDLSNIPLQDSELIVILSNLFDNAIEACLLNKQDKVVKFRFSNTNSEYIINIQNKYEHELNMSPSNTLLSTKNQSNHGFGIKNVLAIIKKHHFQYSIMTRNNLFSFTIIIPK